MNENVIKVLKENMWDIATCADEVNVVPVAFKAVLADGRLAVADVFLKATLENIAKNPQVAVSAYDAKTMEGYQIKGKAHYEAEGEIADSVKAPVENNAMSSPPPLKVCLTMPEPGAVPGLAVHVKA